MAHGPQNSPRSIASSRGRYRISESGGGPCNCKVLKRGPFPRTRATFYEVWGSPKRGEVELKDTKISGPPATSRAYKLRQPYSVGAA